MDDGTHLFFIKAEIGAPMQLDIMGREEIRVELFVGKSDLYGCSLSPGQKNASCESFSNGQGQKYNSIWIPFKSEITSGNKILVNAWRKYEQLNDKVTWKTAPKKLEVVFSYGETMGMTGPIDLTKE